MSRKIPQVEQKKSEIIGRYMLGEPVIELATQYGLSRERIYQYLRELQEWEEEQTIYQQRKAHRDSFKKEKLKNEVIRRVKAGQGVTKIASELGIASLTVHKLLKGTRYKTGNKAKAIRDRQIVREHRAGMSQAKLAKKYNLAQTNISRIIIKYADEQV